MECNICLEKYTSKLRTPIKCDKCNKCVYITEFVYSPEKQVLNLCKICSQTYRSCHSCGIKKKIIEFSHDNGYMSLRCRKCNDSYDYICCTVL